MTTFQRESQQSTCNFGAALLETMSSPMDYIPSESFDDKSLADMFEMIEPKEVAKHVESCEECTVSLDELEQKQKQVEQAKQFDGNMTEWMQN